MRIWPCLAFVFFVQALHADCDREWVPGTVLSLDSGWKLGRSGDGTSPDLDDSNWRRVAMPLTFGKDPELASYHGDLWFRCHITLNGEKPENLAIYLGRVLDMDEVSFNGSLVGRTGSFARNTVDIETDRLYSLPAGLWREGDNVIAVRLRGSTGESGFADRPRIENEQAAARRIFLKYVPAIVCSVLYILTSGFFFLFYAFFRHRYEHLSFALFSSFLGIYHLIRTNLRLDMFTSFEWSFQVELALLFALPSLFINYLVYLLKLKRPAIVWGLMGFSLILILGALLSGAGKWPIMQAWSILIRANLVGLAVSMAVILWIVGAHYKDRRDELRYIVYGFLVLTPAVIHDMLVTLQIINTPRVTVYAFLLFLGFISVQLSDSILELYRNLKHQENDLKLLEKKKTTSILNVSSEFRAISERFEAGIKEMRAGRDAETSQLNGASLHLEKFVHDSRLLHMLEEGEYSIRRIRFNLKKLCEDTVGEALSVAGQNKKRVQMNFPDVEILADPDLISTALYHLVENGLLYTKGRVEVVGELQAGSVHFAVRDEGPGLSPELQKQVFLKFERAVDENSEIPGSGIGLAIVSLIAERLGGRVSLEGGGFFSTYRFHFPLAIEGGA